MAYYQRIRDLREDADKTQREIADYLGTAYQYYSLYEKGRNEISFERAILLAKYYDVSLDYIAGLTNNKRGLSKGDLDKYDTYLLTLLRKHKNRKKIIAEIIRLIKLIDED